MAEQKREELQKGIESATKVKESDIESKIKDAMRSRITHFREQSDSLTFQGVRRLLEKDLGMEEFSLDVHKRFVKQLLDECLNRTAEKASKDPGEKSKKDILLRNKESTELPEEVEPKTDMKEPMSEDGEKMEDSPVMGLLTGQGKVKPETEETQPKENKVPNESTIKKALWKRAPYIKANSEKVTIAGLRRLLEEDLKLDKHALDPFRKFVSRQLDELLKSFEVAEPMKKNVTKSSHGKASSKKVIREESSDASDKDSGKEDEEEEKPKKKPTKKVVNSEHSKKRKRPNKEAKASSKRQAKPAEKVVEDSSDAEDGGNVSEDNHSESSAEKSVKKKEPPTPVYGKRVEHLKSVIKSCGMSVPPSIYKKVKQVPENKREAQLIKELEEILSREGLSSNPSEKAIKEVRKKKERAKELEGIDMGNIVSSSRRRSTTSYIPPPKPKIPVENDDVADDSEEDDEDDDGDDNEEADGNIDDEDGDNDGDDDSESEEVDEEVDEDSD